MWRNSLTDLSIYEASVLAWARVACGICRGWDYCMVCGWASWDWAPMMSVILHHHHECSFRRADWGMVGWSKCSIVSKNITASSLASSVITAIFGLLLLLVPSSNRDLFSVLKEERLATSHVAPGLTQFHACSNSKTNVCSGEIGLEGVQWSSRLVRICCTLDRGIAPWPRVAWCTRSGSYSTAEWISWFRHRFWRIYDGCRTFPVSNLPLPNYVVSVLSFWRSSNDLNRRVILKFKATAARLFMKKWKSYMAAHSWMQLESDARLNNDCKSMMEMRQRSQRCWSLSKLGGALPTSWHSGLLGRRTDLTYSLGSMCRSPAFLCSFCSRPGGLSALCPSYKSRNKPIWLEWSKSESEIFRHSRPLLHLAFLSESVSLMDLIEPNSIDILFPFR